MNTLFLSATAFLLTPNWLSRTTKPTPQPYNCTITNIFHVKKHMLTVKPRCSTNSNDDFKTLSKKKKKLLLNQQHKNLSLHKEW